MRLPRYPKYKKTIAIAEWPLGEAILPTECGLEARASANGHQFLHDQVARTGLG